MNETFNNIKSNDIYVSVFTESFKKNPRCAAELGFAIMLGKPVHLLVELGTKMPEVLNDLAVTIEYYDGKSNEETNSAILRFSEKLRR